MNATILFNVSVMINFLTLPPKETVSELVVGTIRGQVVLCKHSNETHLGSKHIRDIKSTDTVGHAHAVRGRDEGQTEPLAGVFVFISNHVAGKFNPPAEPIQIILDESQGFNPGMFGIVAGQSIEITKNYDKPDQVYLFKTAKERIWRSFPPGKGASWQIRGHPLLQSDGLVRIKSDNPRISTAYCVVLPHPYFAVTEGGNVSDNRENPEQHDEKTCCARGMFQIEHVSRGSYELTAWHPTFGRVSTTVAVRAGEVNRVDFRFNQGRDGSIGQIDPIGLPNNKPE